ncbi:hypothetical protein WOLCODRAFT_151966 [Wolfiporia cocos MD-104 SS10]|uniref:Uncharacterized protein n=1 Tax=Wolfiporia cocos (strain MD-104) TaxID=742152 RepID=A0A2H3JJA8_WOLCO|nr:hypothetical protein WOLCODRAFT_151966 [Wolfiporia cocos MD-104 SS10]
MDLPAKRPPSALRLQSARLVEAPQMSSQSIRAEKTRRKRPNTPPSDGPSQRQPEKRQREDCGDNSSGRETSGINVAGIRGASAFKNLYSTSKPPDGGVSRASTPSEQQRAPANAPASRATSIAPLHAPNSSTAFGQAMGSASSGLNKNTSDLIAKIKAETQKMQCKLTSNTNNVHDLGKKMKEVVGYIDEVDKWSKSVEKAINEADDTIAALTNHVARLEDQYMELEDFMHSTRDWMVNRPKITAAAEAEEGSMGEEPALPQPATRKKMRNNKFQVSCESLPD